MGGSSDLSNYLFYASDIYKLSGIRVEDDF